MSKMVDTKQQNKSSNVYVGMATSVFYSKKMRFEAFFLKHPQKSDTKKLVECIRSQKKSRHCTQRRKKNLDP